MTIKKKKTSTIIQRLLVGVILITTVNITHSANALNPPDTLKASEYFRKGDALLIQRVYDSSRFYFEKALTQYEHAAAWGKSVACHNKVGEAYFGMLDYDNAILSARKALRISNTRLRKRNLGDAESYRIMGLAHSYKSTLDSSIYYYQQALDISSALLGPHHRYVGKIYARMGGVMVRKVENGIAIEYFEKALQIFLKSNIKNDPDVAEQYNGLGRCHTFMQDYESALHYLNLALNIYRNSLGENNDMVAICINNIGLTHSNMGHYAEALDCFYKSISIYEALYHGQHPYVLMSYRNIGDVQRAKGQYALAYESFLKAASIGKRLLNEIHPAVASCYFDILELSIETGDSQRALEFARKSLIANGVRDQQLDLKKNPSLTGAMDLELATRTLRGKGAVLYSMYNASKDAETLRYALDTYRLCDSLSNVVRKSYRSRADKLGFGIRLEGLCQDGLSGYWNLYQTTHNRINLDSAFYYSERSRAAILSDALAEVNARTMGGIPNDLIELEKSLREEQGAYTSALQMAKGQNKNNDVSNATDKLFRVNRKYDSLLLVFEKRYPKFYQIKYNDKLASAQEIQNYLDAESAWIQYFISGKTAFVFTITREDFTCIKLENVDSLGVLVKEFRNVLDPLNNKTESLAQFRKYAALGHELYLKVMDQALATVSNKKKLIIIPDGELGYIPFDVLLTTSEDLSRVHYGDLSYLLNRYSIRYGYSATLLLNNRSASDRTNGEFIAFAPVYTNTTAIADSQIRSKLTGLSWNQQEVKDISQYMGGTTFLGDQALERNFKKEADKYGIIHLAMHALVDDRKPMFSKLAFTLSNDSIDDGFLNAYELYTMNISAQMVVLSACETGYGKLEKGEGVMSLAHAFTYAGCPSVVMSHWVADDRATAQLMELFYQYINQGMAKDVALQKAKIDFMKSADGVRQNPAFWAGFVVLGDAEPLIMKSFFERYWIQAVVLSFGVLTFLIFFVQKRRKAQRK